MTISDNQRESIVREPGDDIPVYIAGGVVQITSNDTIFIYRNGTLLVADASRAKRFDIVKLRVNDVWQFGLVQ